jgi:transposase InsO family protein
MDTAFCSAALAAAFHFGQPQIWNSDQGAQFTSVEFLAPLKARGVAISMDGRAHHHNGEPVPQSPWGLPLWTRLAHFLLQRFPLWVE